MTPSLISFVGVDNKTDQEEILSLQDTDFISFESKEPTFEWGVLVSPERAGKQNRYPSIDFAHDFVTVNNGFGTSARSIHLCGNAVDDYLFRPDSQIGFFASHALARIQLNFNINKYNLDEITEIIINRLVVERHELILQYNKSKQKFVDNLLQKLRDNNDLESVNLSILYDGSGGFGRVIEKFNPPVQGCYTGYAGGINPDNVEDIVKSISKVAGDQEYYIDMESGVRTDDFLDLEKCKSIIKTVRQLANEEIFE